jgi:hypothetical protein
MNHEIEKDFDLEKIKVSQDFLQMATGKQRLLSVPIRKPKKQHYVRTHSDPRYSMLVYLLELQDEMGEVYVLHPEVPDAATEAKPVNLVGAITKNGNFFFWPLKVPDPDGKVMEAHRSSIEAAQIAQQAWIRIFWDAELQSYKVKEATADFGDPKWPEQTPEELFKIAFRNKLITDPDHVVLKRLRGEV